MTEVKDTTTAKATVETGSAKTRILIVDDHQLVRVGLVALIEAEPDLEVCGEASDQSTALKLVREQAPDIAFVDLSLGQDNGLDLIRQIRSGNPTTLVVVLSMHDETIFAERALQAGAVAYVSKRLPADAILTAVRQVREGGVYLSARMTSHVLQRSLGGIRASTELPIGELSDRELEVFQSIGQGLTTREISEHLHLSPKTVATYRDRIRQKLKVKTLAELNRRACLWLLEDT